MNAPMQPGYRARAEAAEARVAELEAAVKTNADWGTEMQEARDKANAALAGVIQMAQDRADERDAAEAREQALRDRVAAQTTEWERMAAVKVEGERFNPDKSAGIAAGLDAAIRDARAILSPPTADTEESDR